MHNDFEAKTSVEGGSDRNFGLVFTVVFALIGLFPLIGGNSPIIPLLGVAGGFLGVSLIAPKLLAPLNKLWFKFGMLLSKIVSPIVLGILFFGTIMPIGLLMRLFGKDPLRLKLEPEAKSYWIERDPAGPAPESLKNQF